MVRQGFSIIEVLIALTIMGIVTMVAVGNFRSAQQRQEIKGIAQTLASDLRRAQAMSLNGTKTPSGALARGGYGIFFDTVSSPKKYILFAEEPFIPPAAPPNVASVDGLRGVGNYADIATVILPPSTTMEIGGGNTTLDFIPPRATACSGGAITVLDLGGATERLTCSTTGLPITIRFARSGIEYQVVINRATGAISVQ